MKRSQFLFAIVFITAVSLTLTLAHTQTRISTKAAGTSVAVTLFLHGIGKGGDSANPIGSGNMSPQRTQRAIQLEVYNQQNQLVGNQQGRVTYNATNGNFTGTIELGITIPTGVYTVKIKSNQYLRTLVPGIQTITSGQTATLAPTYLITGDSNNDNIVNIADYNILLGCYSDLTPATNCTATQKSAADITDDGNVNAFDYNLFLRELTNLQGEPGGTSPTSTPTPTSVVNGSWWKPTADKPIQLHWQLTSKFNPATDFVPGATVYDFDGEWASKSDVDAVHARGFIAICYIDVGVYETYRTDAGKFPGTIPNGTRGINPDTGKPAPAYAGDPQYANVDIIGGKDGDWEGSYWLDIRRLDIIGPIMKARMQMCKDKGFDAVEPDEQNVEGNKQEAGFAITVQDQLNYNKWIADTAHSLGLSVGLKSDVDHAAQSHQWYDWNLTEECYQYNECSLLQPFRDANKATWIVEYATNPNCTNANNNRYNAMRRDLDLMGPTASSYRFTPCLPVGTIQWP